jgi:hypothetical protein
MPHLRRERVVGGFSVAHKHGVWCGVAISMMGHSLRVIKILRFDLF